MKTALQKNLEELYSLKWNRKVDIYEILRTMYVEQKKSQNDIAKELRIGVGTVNKWLKENGIGAKKMYWI